MLYNDSTSSSAHVYKSENAWALPQDLRLAEWTDVCCRRVSLRKVGRASRGHGGLSWRTAESQAKFSNAFPAAIEPACGGMRMKLDSSVGAPAFDATGLVKVIH